MACNQPGQWSYMISYKQDEARTEATKLCYELGKEKVWLDVHMSNKSVLAMEEAVRNSHVFVAILTPGYMQSEFCRKEIIWALNFGKEILTAYPASTNIGKVFNAKEFPSELEWVKQIDAIKLDTSDDAMFAVGLDKIVQRSAAALRNNLAVPSGVLMAGSTFSGTYIITCALAPAGAMLTSMSMLHGSDYNVFLSPTDKQVHPNEPPGKWRWIIKADPQGRDGLYIITGAQFPEGALFMSCTKTGSDHNVGMSPVDKDSEVPGKWRWMIKPDPQGRDGLFIITSAQAPAGALFMSESKVESGDHNVRMSPLDKEQEVPGKWRWIITPV